MGTGMLRYFAQGVLASWFAVPLLAGGPSTGKEQHLLYVARDRKSTRLNSSHIQKSRMPSSA